MPQTSRYYVLKIALDDENTVDGMTQELMASFKEAGVEVEAYDNLNRLIVIVPDSFPHARTNEVFDDMAHEVSDMWSSQGPSGRTLSINLFYHDEEQVVSASVNEGLLLAALASDNQDNEDWRLRHAVTALAEDGEFTFGYGPLNGDMSIQDIMIDVIFWNSDEALRWSPLSWDPEEPMVDISFTPQAELENGNIVPVRVDVMDTSWSMPARLVPADLDLDDPLSMDRLASLPCAPEAVCKWVEMMPYEVTIDNPEILAAVAEPDPDL